MKHRQTILIADPSRNIREFLKRELNDPHLTILLAGNAGDVLTFLSLKPAIDLLIIDPDLPDAVEKRLMNQIADRFSSLKIIIHTNLGHTGQGIFSAAAIIDKNGQNIDRIKQLVFDILESSFITKPYSKKEDIYHAGTHYGDDGG